MVDQGPSVLRTVVGMHRKTRAFIDQQNVLVLIDDVQLGGGNRQVGVVLPGFIEKLVVDIKLQYVSGV